MLIDAFVVLYGLRPKVIALQRAHEGEKFSEFIHYTTLIGFVRRMAIITTNT